MSRLVVQLAGEAGAGKTEARQHLAEEFGFAPAIVSDVIRDHAMARDLRLASRVDYLIAYRHMKQARGINALRDALLATEGDLICVDGIRVPNEVDRLKASQNIVSKVIALDCPAPTRFARIRARGRDIDPATYEEFLEDDAADAFSADRELQSTLTVMEEADFHIDATRPLPEVRASIDEIVVPLLGFLRPIIEQPDYYR